MTMPDVKAGCDPTRGMILGWQEWVALPDLGLPAIKAKIDTGARTSALHAFDIAADGAAFVTFKVHPVPRRADIVISCRARMVDARDVTSSNGERERRVVIATDLLIGGLRRPIEITLTNRALMRTRMLLGRQALGDGVLVAPDRMFCQPHLSYRVYRARKLKSA